MGCRAKLGMHASTRSSWCIVTSRLWPVVRMVWLLCIALLTAIPAHAQTPLQVTSTPDDQATVARAMPRAAPADASPRRSLAPAKRSKPTAAQAATVAALQAALVAANCFLGRIDGVWNKETVAALRKFEKVAGGKFDRAEDIEATLRRVLNRASFFCVPEKPSATPKSTSGKKRREKAIVRPTKRKRKSRSVRRTRSLRRKPSMRKPSRRSKRRSTANRRRMGTSRGRQRVRQHEKTRGMCIVSAHCATNPPGNASLN